MRRRFTETDRQRFYKELDRSGDSAWRVAHRMGLNATTVYRWLAGRKIDTPTFARVVRARSEPRGSSIGIDVGGVRVVIDGAFDPELLRAVVNALSGGES